MVEFMSIHKQIEQGFIINSTGVIPNILPYNGI